MRLEISVACGLKRSAIRPMRRVEIVKASAARNKSTACFRVVDPVNEPHVLAHAVAMKVRRTERMLCDHPARWENHKINVCDPWRIACRCQNRKDRRIGMIKAHGIDRVELSQIVFEWN